MRRAASLVGLGIAVASLMPAVAQATPTRSQILSLVCQGSFEDAAKAIDGLPADVHDTLVTVNRAWLLAVAGEAAKARELLGPVRAMPPSGRLVDACTGAEVTKPWTELLDAIPKAPASVPTLDDPESSGWVIGAPPPKVAAPPASASPPSAVANQAAPMVPAAQMPTIKAPTVKAPTAKADPHSPPGAATGKAPGTPEMPKGGPAPATPVVPPPAPVPATATATATASAPAKPVAPVAASFVQLGVIRMKSSAPVMVAAARAVLPNLPGMDRLILEPIQGRDLLRMLLPVDDPVATCRALADRRVPCIVHPPRRN